MQKSNGKLYWYGMQSDPLAETDLAGNNPVEYVFFNGKRIARRDSSGNVSYYFADHLGSSRVVTNSAGTVLDDSDFYPFGGERPVLSSSGNAYKFTSKERDTESGLDNMGFRAYSSATGRFLQPDPIMASGRVENPQTWNRYSYALNNPLRFIDPLGLFPSPAFNCSDSQKACLNDQQREILNNSTGTDKDGNKVSGEALYNTLDEKQKNAFVNVTDRLDSIKFSDGSTALDSVKSITSFEVDRVKANVDSGLAGKIEGDSRFQKVSGALHPGFDAISFKSKDAQGNIQFSFSQSRTGADIDHDLFQGFRHTFEVLQNHMTGSKTDQDAVRRLLIARPEVAITPSPDSKFNRPPQ